MKARMGCVLAGCVLGFATLTREVAADEPAQCAGAAIEPAASSGFPLAPVRNRELWLGTGLVGDWSPGAAMKPSLALGLEWVPILSATQRVRLGLYGGVSFGHFGDETHAIVAGDTSLRLRTSPYMDDFFDVYTILKAGLALAGDPFKTGFRPGAGIGFRVLRAVSLEATADGLIAIGDRFADGSRIVPGMTIALSVDLCVPLEACERPPRPPSVQRSLTCDLYAQAGAICQRAVDRAELCQAVAAALDANAFATAERYDAIDAFFAGMRAHAGNERLKAELKSVQALHRALLKQVDAAKEAERVAAQRSAWLPVHCSYAPVAAELREAFGCDPQSEPSPKCRAVPGCEP